ncbi:lasso peptide biosynthesis B2 protein [Caulobacter hibisci]|uniref:Lasso peptide biosynthesis B2 protein n=1 Tax=Caulobacter hibisci TaxID=2035993 RepID=A0ABS0SZW3_9CAUL|nr:lasso peptide biosynthesis B2 protein [Caulobacter hibisci]MBI1685172.1 lasso peptide biosynthesis B2 protein [Caulobacter hibisci]
MAPDVHAAKLGQDVVLLDADGGSYFCLAGGAASFDAVPPWRLNDADLAHELLEAGLASPYERAVEPLPERAVHDLACPPAALSGRIVGDGAKAYGVALRHYYRRRFRQILAYARSARRTPTPCEACPDLARAVAAFRLLLPLAPFPGLCFFRSFLLLAFLRQAGLEATWMFGVKTWSFEAHCWLQVGDTVLDDRAERLVLYTPILAV